MPRIASDPGLETCPDFSAPPFEVVRQAMLATGLDSTEVAIQHLSEAWLQHNHARREAWARQLEEDRAAEEQAETARREAEEEQRRQEAEVLEAERQEVEKKKPKMSDFDDRTTVADVLHPRPAQFALNKLESFEYVELWYFTPEGCIDATEDHASVAEDAYGLTKNEDYVALRPLASFRASRNVVQDQNLTWRQLEIGRHTFLDFAAAAKWPIRHLEALGQFWLALEISEYRLRPRGERILLIYQARVRREWHDSLKRQQGFNIGKINHALLRKVADEVYDNWRADATRRYVPFP
jgi:hypothetical protein